MSIATDDAENAKEENPKLLLLLSAWLFELFC
jgi:hypothetical protein